MMTAILDLDFVCQHPDIVQGALRKRHDVRNIDDILRFAEQRCSLVTRCDGLHVALKGLKEGLRTSPLDQWESQNNQIRAVTEEIQQLELQISNLDIRLRFLLQSLPNIPHVSVKEDDGTTIGDEVRCWGQPFPRHTEPLPHWQIGERLGIIDAESGVRVAGSRFIALKGEGARLERALISFMLDLHTREHGYLEVMPPQLVKRSVMVGAGQLPKFEDQSYACAEDELYLNPTAEVPLVGMYQDTTLLQDVLPIRLVAWTTAFRRETGSTIRQMRGILQLHQFNSIELFQIVEPDNSYAAHEQMVQHAEAVLQRLELPYRVVVLNATHLSFTSAKTYEIEVWMPETERYIEISSVSNCECFQSQRANIKYRRGTSTQSSHVHTLNGSGLAVERTMAAILENYQQADGSVIIPKALRPYMRTSSLSPA
jgi:seryl-tRNA synthetase